MTIELPCKIGDTAWAIRNLGGHKRIVSGKVSEMYFIEEMNLVIVVKNVARGLWGKAVFGTFEEAERVYDEHWKISQRA